MPVTRQVLAQKLKNAREVVGLTQLEAAKQVGLSRTALALVESGKRALEAIEMSRLVQLYELTFHDLFMESEAGQDSLQILFRASAIVEQDLGAKRQILHARKLAKDVSYYEDMTGGRAESGDFMGYDVAPPASKGAAIEQGMELAAKERARLRLGSQPVWELPEILRREGIRVAELRLPKSVSGLTLRLEEGGDLIIVNRDHVKERRLFSYAHELCHVVADRGRSALVSGDQDKKDPLETRADVFAADFLMPKEGIQEFLKSTLGRSYKDSLAEKHWPEAAQLARYFAVSFQAAVFRLKNLDIISEAVMTVWQDPKHPALEYKKNLKGPELKENGYMDLESQLVEAALRALREEKISRKKFVELCKEAGLKDEKQVAALAESAIGPLVHDVVGPW